MGARILIPALLDGAIQLLPCVEASNARSLGALVDDQASIVEAIGVENGLGFEVVEPVVLIGEIFDPFF
jgi:hypothetical protein